MNQRAKELLLAAKARILEEPRRLNMGLWILTDVNREKLRLYGEPKHYGIPPCETVACIAGHICLAEDPEFGARDEFWASGISASARNLMGLSDYSAHGLFYETSWPIAFQERLAGVRPGTKKYAKIVADRIDAWIAEHDFTDEAP